MGLSATDIIICYVHRSGAICNIRRSLVGRPNGYVGSAVARIKISLASHNFYIYEPCNFIGDMRRRTQRVDRRFVHLRAHAGG